jgi:hypothetical protein
MRKVTARGYYGIVNRLIDVRLGDGIGDFRLLSRRAVEAVLSLRRPTGSPRDCSPGSASTAR